MTRTSTRKASSRRVLAASMLLVPALLLSGCVPSWLQGLVSGGTVSTPTGEEVADDVRPYYQQVLTWTGCGGGAECATAVAPLDWNNPGEGDDIELALVRHAATGGTPQGSLFINPGGPGASGFDFVRDSVDFAVSAELREQFDIVGWDPRGVGRSSAVTCYTDPADLDEFIFGIPEAEFGTPEWGAEVIAGSIDFAEACAENTGPLLGFVDTNSTVRDLDMLRAVVGDEQLNFFGYSYGTDIGARYADRFADKVGRLVLDGATDPTTTTFEVVLAQSEGFENALRAYLLGCPDLGSCPFPGSVDESLTLIRELYERLGEEPIEAADGRFFDGAVLDIAIATALYDEGSWSFLSQMFTELRTGVVETGFLLADFYYGRENGEYIDNSLEAFIAINCLDYPVETDRAVIAEQNAQIRAVAPTTAGEGNPLGDVLCANWPHQFEGELRPVSGAGAAPILVIGTTGDPATPYIWAEALAEQLESGVLLTWVGEGHIAYDEGDPCINDLVDAYFITGAVPVDGLVCDPDGP
ncbi:alpha/beta hydrolase [Microcella sp.]|uniref:alpha/beta hydrolase n=1 Tax=Microcella sp. TaxID=1913979 RepID=UPI0025F30E40|nr:alpha/beta hydrolase [Microcella sp.]